MTTGSKPRPIYERFHESYEIVEPGGCWVWTGWLTSHEYGCMLIGSRTDKSRRKVGAHRISWELHFGMIPDGLYVCHHCDVPSCVNPAHLFVGTGVDNMQDAKRKGRLRKPDHFRTHCRNGHAYSIENTVWIRGLKSCRSCQRENRQRHYWRNRDKILTQKRETYLRRES